MARKPRKRDMPAQAETPEAERKQLVSWWQEQLERMDLDHKERMEMLQEVGPKHPARFFARQVKMFGALGISKPLVATLLGMSLRQLELYYNEEYLQGDTEIVASVATNMLRIATSQTDPNAAKVGMDFLARRGGELWKPPAQKIKVDPPDNTPSNVIDSSRLTPEEREQLRRILVRATSEEPLLTDESEGAET